MTTDSSLDAVVVGAGPNGLAAAVILARAGLSVEVHEAASTPGGGARTEESTLPGHRHDVCSAVHPMGLASPFFRAFDLAAHGVRMLQPDLAYAHPLDGGRAGLAWRDLGRTAAGLGVDGRAWRGLLGPLAAAWPGVVDLAMSDLRGVPADPLSAIRLARRMLEQGSPLWNLRFRDEIAPAMFTGVCAHAIAPSQAIAPAGAGLLLAALAHGVGWPIPEGGSAAITDALVADLRAHGSRVITGSRIDRLAQLPRARAVLLDLTPAGLLRIAGSELPERYARRLAAFRYGGAACKVDFALRAPVPWANSDCASAGTLHLIGSRADAVVAQRAVAAGLHAERPFVLAVQPGVVDPGRAPAGSHTLWTYAHVPQGSDRDVSAAVIDQIERFAPGFREIVAAHRVRTAMDLQGHDANYVGGDIAAGAVTLRQLIARPVLRFDPYATPLDGVYLCSASTPPGPGVHGMAGLHAARRVLRQRFGITDDPLRLLRQS
ncbi:phytoene desaturase family protein [Actinoalloteichus hymeniacidonis]|uniref:Phytoene dehydrogenase-like oxidoreductase n=1 Tax=Actinoalloteichus hymeniacidonis TaxID=340345 RepID=A0AAC9MYU9_9PSEU|nr:NAD(P)/FAD-dependent oxidoreductase [Actinoalloteichus hymeniacidonis]AOS63256.1 phytoene dehydrogenase-like oxidoreductase [Actinoalloteichus hymeniacidonis]MBB5908705.1 phytoene dehydrogenase-like protein [Actinoalloteichus hymeniacidonis]